MSCVENYKAECGTRRKESIDRSFGNVVLEYFLELRGQKRELELVASLPAGGQERQVVRGLFWAGNWRPDPSPQWPGW